MCWQTIVLHTRPFGGASVVNVYISRSSLSCLRSYNTSFALSAVVYKWQWRWAEANEAGSRSFGRAGRPVGRSGRVAKPLHQIGHGYLFELLYLCARINIVKSESERIKERGRSSAHRTFEERLNYLRRQAGKRRGRHGGREGGRQASGLVLTVIVLLEERRL